MKKHPWKRPFTSALLFTALVIVWVVFTPTQLGGNVAYVVLSGNSMEPAYHQGDLVVVKAARTYQLDDVVAYRHPEIGPVFHRIVEIEDGRCLMKGDNNDWHDSYTPSKEEIIGKLWVDIPWGGSAVMLLRQPLNFTLLVVGVLAMTFIPGVTGSKKKGQKFVRPPKIDQLLQMVLRSEKYQEQVFVVATLGLIALVLGLVAFSRPTTREAEELLLYQHIGEYSYSAKGALGLYDQSNAQTGEPIFLNVSDEIDLKFNYSLSGDQISSAKGSYRFVAQISEETGWKRTIELQEKTLFEGPAVEISGTLNLNILERMIGIYQMRTGILRSDFIVSIVPEIQIEAGISGESITDQFAPALQFSMSQYQLALLQIEPDEGNLLKPVRGGSFQVNRSEPNTIPLFSYNLPVITARWISVVIISGIIVLGAFVYWWMVKLVQKGEKAQIEAFYGDLIFVIDRDISIQEMTQLQRFDQLVGLAVKNNAIIKSSANADRDCYYVQLPDETYYYAVQTKELDSK